MSNNLTAQDLIDQEIHYHDIQDLMSLMARDRLQKVTDQIRDTFESVDVRGEYVPLANGLNEVRENVVAHPSLGHQVRFTIGDETYTGILEQLHGRAAEIIVDGNTFTQEYKDIEVSTLGQERPRTLSEIVQEEVPRQFLPKTILDSAAAKDTIIALMSGNNILFHGPPGSGKSQAMKDIISLLPDHRYIISDARMGTHPYEVLAPDISFSAYDRDAAVDPTIWRSTNENFWQDAVVVHPDPKDLGVTKQKFSEGYGVVKISGKKSIRELNLAGYEKPFDESKEDLRDPSAVVLGLVTAANNGVLALDEADKLKPEVLEVLLETLQDEKIRLQSLGGMPLPANNYFIGTSNDSSTTPEAANDRIAFIPIPYSADADDNMKILDMNLHGTRFSNLHVEAEQLYKMEFNPLEQVPLTRIKKMALTRVYTRFRDERENLQLGAYGKFMGSNRSMIDAARASRAHFTYRTTLHEETEGFVSAEDVVEGISYAMRTRIAERDMSRVAEISKKVNEFVAETFAEEYEHSKRNFWCRANRWIATQDTAVAGTAAKFTEEKSMYENTPEMIEDVFAKFTKSADDPYAQLDLTNQHPFMGYLASEQPRFFEMAPSAARELVSEYLREEVDC